MKKLILATLLVSSAQAYDFIEDVLSRVECVSKVEKVKEYQYLIHTDGESDYECADAIHNELAFEELITSPEVIDHGQIDLKVFL